MSFGAPTTSGYSPFYASTVGIAGAANEASYNAMTRYGRAGTERLIARALGMSGYRGFRKVMRVLNGAAAGSAASETYTRVGTTQQGPALTGPGGAIVMETYTANSGNTTSAQKTYIDNLLDQVYNQQPTSYPTDASGNGGGGKGASTGIPAR